MSGKLYIVATPIGNLADITLRAKHVLAEVDLIAAEDKRHSVRLLQSIELSKPLISYHDHNAEFMAEKLLAKLQAGQSIALISDAGTPLISDPGYRLVKIAHDHDISVVPIPGACALIAALSVAGLPTDRFSFIGFLPAKQAARQKRLLDYKYIGHTLVFYESPKRLVKALAAVVEVMGADRPVVVARELTKLHESVLHFTAQSAHDWYQQHMDQCRGEVVVLIAGKQAPAEAEGQAVLDILLVELPAKQAAALASKITGVAKNKLYQLALRKK